MPLFRTLSHASYPIVHVMADKDRDSEYGKKDYCCSNIEFAYPDEPTNNKYDKRDNRAAKADANLKAALLCRRRKEIR